jgi:formyl-CoA transferase
MAGQILADMGADVIKVEPIGGEPWRHQAEFMPGESRVFLPLNRGVRSVCLDLRRTEARDALARIVATADAAISNHRPDTAEKLKIDYESLAAINPRLVYVEITGYGRRGPRADMPGFDLIMQGFSGVVAAEGKFSPPADPAAPLQPEVVWSSSFIDFSTAYAAAAGVMGGLLGRHQTGKGQKVSTSLLVNALNMQCMRIARVEGNLSPPQRWVNERLPALREAAAAYETTHHEYREVVRSRIYRTYYRAYRTSDGALCLGALAVPTRLRLLDYLGLNDPRVQQPGFDETSPAGLTVAREIEAEFERRFALASTGEWVRELRARDIPCEPVRFTEEMTDDEQSAANGYVIEAEHAAGFKFRAPGPILQYSDGMPPSRPSPATGQHTAEVLAEAGLDAGQITALITSGAAG